MRDDLAALCAALADECDMVGLPMRQHVVGLVQRGKISREDAEGWARETGEHPFECEPDAALFDPMTRPDWTLAMATAWAIWRTPDAVRRAWTPFLSGCNSWRACSHNEPRAHAPGGWEPVVGYDLAQLEPVSPYDVRLSARTRVMMTAARKRHPAAAGEDWESAAPVIDPEQVEREVCDALRAGVPLVACHGIADKVDPHAWATLSPFTDGKGGPEDVHDRGGVVRFHRVRVERDAVLAVWDAKPSATEPAIEPALASEQIEHGANPKAPLRGGPLRAFVLEKKPPPGMSKERLYKWLQEKAQVERRAVDRVSTRKLHGTDVYPDTAPRGRPRNSAN